MRFTVAGGVRLVTLIAACLSLIDIISTFVSIPRLSVNESLRIPPTVLWQLVQLSLFVFYLSKEDNPTTHAYVSVSLLWTLCEFVWMLAGFYILFANAFFGKLIISHIILLLSSLWGGILFGIQFGVLTVLLPPLLTNSNEFVNI